MNMSQTSSNKGKDVLPGKKFTSLNINQRYKGSKADNKPSSVQSSRHGMQSLGKIQRVRQFTDLPSLKKENSGNDPRVNLVPTGSQGWGKKEAQEKVLQGDSIGASGGKDAKKSTEDQDVSLRPNAGVAVKGGDESGKMTWGIKAQRQQPPSSGTTGYFQKEFPRLGGDGEKVEGAREKGPTDESVPGVNLLAMALPQFMNGQKWMDPQNVRMPIPPNLQGQFTPDQRHVFNNGQSFPPFPFPMYTGPARYSMPPYFQYSMEGKMPSNFMPGMVKPNMSAPTSTMERPSVVKDADLKSLDNDKEDCGWANSAEEVDYNAKLVFDESDESDEDSSKKSTEEKQSEDDQEKQAKKVKKTPQEAWAENPGFPPHMPMPGAFNQQNWSRMPYPGGPHPSGYYPPMFYMHPYGFPQNMPAMQPGERPDDSKSENRSKDEDSTKGEDRKAAAQAKVDKSNEDLKRQEAELKRKESEGRRFDDDRKNYQDARRNRNDSETSDSMKRCNREIAPRFQRQMAANQKPPCMPSPADVHFNDDLKSDSSQMRIMKRKESLKSDDESHDTVFKKSDAMKSDTSVSRKLSSDSRPRNSSGSLYQETIKKERQSRVSNSSDSYDNSRKGSTSSLQSRDGERKDFDKQSSADKRLKDYDSQRYQDKPTSKDKKSDLRFADLALTKNQNRRAKSAKDKLESCVNETEKNESKKKSAWSTVVTEIPGTENANKSLLEIQKEEEEQLSKKNNESQVVVDVQQPDDRASPTDNKFRSDSYKGKNYKEYGHYERREKYLDERAYNRDYKNNDYPRKFDKRNDESIDKRYANTYKKRYPENYEKRQPEKNEKRYPEKYERKQHEKFEKRHSENYEKRYSENYEKRYSENYEKRYSENYEKRYPEKYDKGYKDKYNSRYDKRDDKRPPRKDLYDDDALEYQNEEGVDYKRPEYNKGERRREHRNVAKFDKKEIDYEQKDNVEGAVVSNKTGVPDDHRISNKSRNTWTKGDDTYKRGSRSSGRYDERSYSRGYKQQTDYYKNDYQQKSGREPTKHSEKSPFQKNWSSKKVEDNKNELLKVDSENAEKPDVQKDNNGKDVIKEETQRNDSRKPNEEISAATVNNNEKSTNDSRKKTSSEMSNKTKNFENFEGSQVKSGKHDRTERRYRDDYSESRGRGRGRRTDYTGSSSRGRGRGGRRHDDSRFVLKTGELSSDSDMCNDENKSLKRKHDMAYKSKIHGKNWENDCPPRFQKNYENKEMCRGRGRGARSSDRGRGHGRNARKHSQTDDKPTQDDKNDDDSENYLTAEESAGSPEDEPTKSRQGSSKEKGFRGRGGRGKVGDKINTRGSKPSSFLGIRQQLRGNRKSLDEKPQPAADKTDDFSDKKYNGELTKKNVQNLEDISIHSPPKKNKPSVEKKRDIISEFDLNNTAGVVCIDDMKNFDSMSMKSTEDDGFVKVKSKKEQKEIRDRIREEEKRKLLLEQKKEVSKVQKAARKEKTVVKKGPTFVDAPMSSVVADQLPVSSPTTSVPSTIVIPPTSNAAMAAMMGTWEPAESLMRTSQNNANLDQVSGTGSVNDNAWKRPLSLNSTSVNAMPDPRAVGTGKPSSAIKTALVPTQPTPEAASPIVTPPALASIVSPNVPVISENTTEATRKNLKTSQPAKQHTKSKTSPVNRTSENDSEKKKEKSSSNKRESKFSSNKRNNSERPPRFQSNTQKDSDERRKYNEHRKSTRHSNDKPVRKGSEKSRKDDRGSPIKSAKSIEKVPSIESDNVFAKDSADAIPERKTKSLLSDEDKVVGSKKPSLKSASTGSFNGEEKIVEMNISNSFHPPATPDDFMNEEVETNVKNTARSVIKSLTDEEERSLETRSLPGSPPLAVKIPEPTLSGPSSDPGKVPSPNTKVTPQDITEMFNRQWYDARMAWDKTPSTWSEPTLKTSVAVVTSESLLENRSPPVENIGLVSPTKPKSIPITSSDLKSNVEDKTSNPSFATKRSEQQQNVCKVKPQQQLPTEEVKPYSVHQPQSNNSVINQNRYLLPVVERHQNLYPSDVYDEHIRAQTALPFQTLGKYRTGDPAMSPLSQQDLLNSTIPVGNLYNTANLQSNQSQMMTWQVVSTQNLPGAKSMSYQTQPRHHPVSLFTSPGSMSTSPVIMPFGTYSPQRGTSNLQRQTLMQVPPAKQNAERMIGVLHPNTSRIRRDQPFQAVNHSSQMLNANGMTLLFDHSSVNQGLAQQHLSQQQRSDLMKHVHAKPFEPTSQTPPLMQSPPVLNHQSVAQMKHQQQALIPGVFSQPSSLKQSQRQHVQNNPLVASVRPRPVHGQTMPAASPPLSHIHNQDRLANMYPMDGNLVFNQLGLVRPQNRTGVNMALHVQPQSMGNQFANSILQQTLHQRGSHPIIAHNKPGPIQRPMPIQSKKIPAGDDDFKRIQREKMLEDTKKYFLMDNAARPTDSETKSDISSSTVESYELTAEKEKEKKFESKKMPRAGDQHRFKRNQRQPRPEDETTINFDVAQQAAKRNSATKV